MLEESCTLSYNHHKSSLESHHQLEGDYLSAKEIE